jgi:hypothetical protein
LTGGVQAFTLFARMNFLKAGPAPRVLMKSLGFDPTPLAILEKYNPDQPQDPAGKRREHALAPAHTRIGIST